MANGTGTRSDPYTTVTMEKWDFPRPFAMPPNTQINCFIENFGIERRMIANNYFSATSDSLFGLRAYRLNGNSADDRVTAHLLVTGRWA